MPIKKVSKSFVTSFSCIVCTEICKQLEANKSKCKKVENGMLAKFLCKEISNFFVHLNLFEIKKNKIVIFKMVDEFCMI